MKDLKNMQKTFNTVVLGGTFDHFHKGHKKFILFAFSLSSKVIVCITSDKYVKSLKLKTPAKGEARQGRQNSKLIKNYEKRKGEVEDFLKKEGIFQRAEIVKIDDVFGITLDRGFRGEAIVVADKTMKGAQKINERRKAMGLLPLEIIKAPNELADDKGPISSSRIRDGEIDREGKLCVNPKFLEHPLFVTEELRKELEKPFGELVEDDSLENYSGLLVTVGDVTTQRFNKLGLGQKISVIDFKVKREKVFSSILSLGFLGLEKIIHVNNPPGTIVPQLFIAAKSAFSDSDKRIIIQIEGEEDLSVLPLVLAAPLGATIFYGQPNEGIVKVLVDEKIKEKAYNLVSAFNTRGY